MQTEYLIVITCPNERNPELLLRNALLDAGLGAVGTILTASDNDLYGGRLLMTCQPDSGYLMRHG